MHSLCIPTVQALTVSLTLLVLAPCQVKTTLASIHPSTPTLAAHREPSRLPSGGLELMSKLLLRIRNTLMMGDRIKELLLQLDLK